MYPGSISDRVNLFHFQYVNKEAKMQSANRGRLLLRNTPFFQLRTGSRDGNRPVAHDGCGLHPGAEKQVLAANMTLTQTPGKEFLMQCLPIGSLWSNSCVRRHPANPILSPKDIPYSVALTSNAGVTKYNGEYVMVFRIDHGSLDAKKIEPFKTSLGLATSKDGTRWEVRPKPCFAWEDDHVRRVYDPRLVVLNGRCHMCFAADTWKHGTRSGIAVTEDFEKFEVLGLTTSENRNLVLFPEIVDGLYYRLERPFHHPGYWTHIWIGASPDLRYWGDYSLLLGFEQVPFANFKIGPAAPPIRTQCGWLTSFHAVDLDERRPKRGWERDWQMRYTAGLMLLDLQDPRKILGLSKEPLLVPEASYEIDGGYRPDVIFPGGMILEDSGEVKIYYGAADTHVCLATAHVNDLLGLCRAC